MMETQIQNVGYKPVISDETDVRWAVNVLLEKIAEKFEANETMDIWRSDAAALVRSFKHVLPEPANETREPRTAAGSLD
jgi:hypothetical protein